MSNFYNGKFRLGKRVVFICGFWVTDRNYINAGQTGIIQKVNINEILPITYNVDINYSANSKAERIYNIPEYILEAA